MLKMMWVSHFLQMTSFQLQLQKEAAKKEKEKEDLERKKQQTREVCLTKFTAFTCHIHVIKPRSASEDCCRLSQKLLYLLKCAK